MPETTTTAEPKPKTKTSNQTKAKPRTKVEPNQQTTVSPDLQRAVNAYVEADTHVQSKYWPLVDEAINLLELEEAKGRSSSQQCQEYVRCQFSMAFAIAHPKIKTGEFEKSVEYSHFRTMTWHVVHVASLGRKAIKEAKQQKMGFWKVLDVYNEHKKNEGDYGLNGKGKAETPPPKPAKNAKRSSKGEDEEPQTKSGNAKVPEWTATWSEAFRHIVQHEPEGLIEDLEFCCARGWLPTDEDWLALAKHVLMGEREN